MKNWHEIYKTQGAVQNKPSKQIVDLVPIFSKANVKRILDHGCGTGRHVKYLQDLGFKVFGTDYSVEAIRQAKNLSPLSTVMVCDMSAIPYCDAFFDAIICSQVIQHGLKPARNRAISEMKRTLKPGGLLFLRTISRKQKVYKRGEKIEPSTYIYIPDLPDGDTPHHYFSKSELKEYFNDFKIIRLEEKSHPPRKNDLWVHGLEELVLLAQKS